MDILAHTLWTNVVFYKKLKLERISRLVAVLFGILPDLVSFAPIFIYRFFSGVEFFELINRNIWIVKYANESYNYTHSLVIFAFLALLVYFFRKGHWYWPMFGWALHILIDIPTHQGFFETPFLFPLSDYQFSHGISWGHPAFMILNYTALAVFYIFWFLVLRKKPRL